MGENEINLESYFQRFRKGIIGNDAFFCTNERSLKMVYADWIASGRLYAPIEHTINAVIGPKLANPHSFSSHSGKITTYAYKYAREIIEQHVNAGEDDILVTTGTGMTNALARLQRIMGMRWPKAGGKEYELEAHERPVVFITHMEHHSNHVSWMETIADVVIVPCNDNLLVSLENLEQSVCEYADRPLKIGAFTACSNVTGIITPYHEMAKIMHKYGGFCVVDFAASAPYVKMDMHPEDPDKRLDAILFSPHKFLGGPGSCGILIFNERLYKASIPDAPGGGNVKWTNPWGEYGYFDDIEIREDGGTPGFLQTMRAAMAIRLKENMGIRNMRKREEEILSLCFERLTNIKGITVLGNMESPRIGCVSFCVENIHYNLIVRLLNDRFGIQVRGGWSCASTYGHYLLNIDQVMSREIIENIERKNLENKPGWIRLSLHPTLTNEELFFICNAIAEVIINVELWRVDYQYNPQTNEFEHIMDDDGQIIGMAKEWLDN